MVVETRQQAKRRKMSDGCVGREDGQEEEGPQPPVKAIVMDAADGPSIPASCSGGSRVRRVKHTHLSLTTRHRETSVNVEHDCIRPENHDMLVHIAPVGEKVRYGQRSSLAIGHDYFRFRCPLGDVWHDAFTDVCRHRLVKTGDPWIDRAIRSLPFQGFDMAHVVGVGRFSFVLAAHCPQKYSGLVAVKMLLLDRTRKRNPKNAAPWHVEFPKEVSLHRALTHPNIISCLDYMTYMNRKCIILEFAHLGDLEEQLQGTPGRFLTEVVAARYFRHMVAAIEYLHSENIVHRDLNCTNWVIDRHNVAKLVDFGCAERWSESDGLMVDPPPGGQGYQPPEALLHLPYSPKMADLWSLGAVLHKMVTSRLPFGTEPCFTPGAMQTIALPEPNILLLSHEIRQLLQGILHPYLACRYSLNRIKQSAWFTTPTTGKFYVSNYFRARQPVKLQEGTLERRWKHATRLTRPPALHNTWVSRNQRKHHRKQATTATKQTTCSDVTTDTDVTTAQGVAARPPVAPEDPAHISTTSSSLSDDPEPSTSSDALQTPAQPQSSSDARDDTARAERDVNDVGGEVEAEDAVVEVPMV